MFTVKQLSKIAGITPRTLHYYDEIGLLKPSTIGSNGYRYYSEDSFLKLQQIMLYRELDIPLEKIKKILQRDDFDVLSTVENHRRELQMQIARLVKIINTVDNTILWLKGKKEMSKKQLFGGLSEEQQAKYEQEAAQKYDPGTVQAANKKWKNYSPTEKRHILDEGQQIYEDYRLAMPFGASSSQAQSCVEHWRRHMEYFWVPNDDQLLGMVDLYNADPRFKANFDQVDPQLADFVRAAVSIYVTNRK